MGNTNSKGTSRQRDTTDGKKSYTPLMKYVHDNVIGDGLVFNGPYGKRAGISMFTYYISTII